MSRARRSTRSDSGATGILVVDKPAGWTSHDVVAKCRGILGTRKVGHSGTLDPDATGVLVLGVGRGTKLLGLLTALPKSYVAAVRFGVETSTLDAAGEVIAEHDMAGLTADVVRRESARFVGEIEQIPPMVSAVKVGGRRLHELAREGIEVERAARRVVVTRFDLHPTDDPLVYTAEVDCGSGTYVRSLAADLGAALGGGAHLISLRRTAVGGFTEADARPMDSAELRPLTTAVAHLDHVVVGAPEAARVAVGAVLERDVLGVAPAAPGPWAVFDDAGRLLAVYEAHRGSATKPQVMVAI